MKNDMNILQSMFDVVRNDKFLNRNAADFIVHDVGFLANNNKKGNVFLWGVRKLGTHMYLLNDEKCSNLNNNNVIREMNISLGYLKFWDGNIDWYLLKIYNDFNLNDGFYPKGSFEKVGFKQICDLIENGVDACI